jgi:GSCFA family
MIQFRTSLTANRQQNTINYNSKIVLFGSCFTEHISEKLNYFKFDTLTNPFGILFNSSALQKAVLDCVDNKTYTKSDLTQHKGLWHSFAHHSQFSSSDVAKTLADINTSINTANSFIKTASHIVVTLGTAWVYTYNETQKIVANCHKAPQKQFTKSLQSISQITTDLEGLYKAIKSVNKKAVIIFTVSPVRHLRNGFTENMLSKAHLIVAVQEHISHNKDCFYVPAYEIMMDDLRDYRFYEADMIHPNSTAINYIWDFFKNSWLSEKVFRTMNDIDSIQKDLQHRPFNTDTEDYKKFKKALEKKIAVFSEQHPSIKF